MTGLTVPSMGVIFVCVHAFPEKQTNKQKHTKQNVTIKDIYNTF